MEKEIRIAILQGKINQTKLKGNGSAGVIRKWEREIRQLSK